ncbi:MAG: intradiol ring-cleavage dioxygenase [Ensifer adhaerens]
MSRYFTEEHSAETVNGRIGEDTAPRVRQVIASLVRHLHDFIKDVELTQREWELAVDFLTRAGQTCTDTRQEFILLSDVLGLSMLVDAIGNRRPEGATENTVFGPFHVANAPIRAMGESISLDGKGESCLFHGRVIDLDGNAIERATIDVWSDNADGFYDVQQPDLQPKWNNRGRFVTGADGAYSFVGIKPVSYPIPDDGPVGDLLAALHRHPYRPAHMHFLVTAPGHQKIVTHIFTGGDPYLTSDAVFGVKSSLIADFERVDGATVWQAAFDFVMV